MENEQPKGGNTGKIVGIVALVIIAFAVAMFMLRGKDDTNTTTDSSTPPAQEVKSGDENKSQSIKNLLTKSGNQECTFSDTSTPNASSQGTVYVSGGKMRGDFQTTASGKSTMSHMIIKDGENFVWTDDSTTGFKMKFDQNSNAQSESPQHGVDPNKNFDYSCKSWSGDSGKFNPPSGVTFTDYSSLFATPPTAAPSGNPAPNMQDMKAMQQAACDSLPEPQKTQCKNAMQ